jgi:hypothetical protein
MKLPRPIIFLATVVGVVFVTIALGLLLVPRFIDSQLIRDQIGAEWAEKTDGNLSFATIALLWFPRPRVVMENMAFSFDDKAQGSIRSVTIYPSLFYLLTGQWVVRQVSLNEPKLRLRLPLRSASPVDLEEWEKHIRSALVRLTMALPASYIELSGGSADIRIGERIPVILENVTASSSGSPTELRFEVSARANLCEQFRVEGKISPQDLASEIDIGVRRLKMKESLAVVPLQISDSLQKGEASLDAKIASVGLRQVKASIEGSVGPFVFERHGGSATVEVKRLKGGVSYQHGAFQADVDQLDFASPQLKVSGNLRFDAGLLSAQMNVRDMDIAELRNLALRVAADREVVKTTFQHLRSGTIAEMNFHSAGASIAEMTLPRNIAVSAALRNGQIFIPGADLALENLSGSVRIADDVLEAKDVTAKLGTAKGWDGRLRLGLKGKNAAFHLDTMVSTGAPELQSVLLKLVQDKPLRAELLKVRDLRGELAGRLILGESLDAISPVVAVSKVNLSATYEPVPFPIAIRDGRFNYGSKIIRLENAQGSVGRSTFGGLGATFHHDGSRRIQLDSKQISLDLHQWDTWTRRFKDLPSYFAQLGFARGRIELENLNLTGAYDDPAQWSVTSAGTFNQVEIRHADFPEPITVSRGKFAASQGRFRFSDTAAAMSDAAFVGGGRFDYKKEGPIQFATSAAGTLGVKMTQWLSRHVELPDEIKFRSPLEIAAGNLAWREDGDISFRGQLTVAGGPLLSLDAVKSPQALAVKNLTIDDGKRRAQIMLQFAKQNIDFSFSGELTQQTIDKIFASFPLRDLSLRGDIQIGASLINPIRVYGRGQLSGENLWIPLGTEKAQLERFIIAGSGDSLLIQAADLQWSKSRVTASGKVAGAGDLLRMDVDITGDRLDWDELERRLGGEGKPPQEKKGDVLSFPGVEGTIRLKTNHFTFKGVDVSPLEATAAISPSAASANIHHGVACGITIAGRGDVVGKEIGVDLQLTASDAQLEPSALCLTNQQNDVKGIYSLDARLAGRGEQGRLLRSLKGNFEFRARNGEFVRSPGIDATFDYLNATGDFKVAFPDLDRETFPYRFVGVTGRIEGEMLIADELNVDSSLLNLSGQGKVDMERKLIDGKGLVAVLRPVDEVIRRIPVISDLFGGSLLGIPVRFSGPLERPDVTYLSPADVGAELLNIPLKILKMPFGAMRLFSPSGNEREKNSTK